MPSFRGSIRVSGGHSSMRVVLQRVSRACVTVNGAVTGEIGTGFVVLVGFTHSDQDEQLQWMADKIAGLRVFADENGKMNRDLRASTGRVLVVSQFTLYGDVRKGRRPSFVAAAPPEQAERLYGLFLEALRERGLPVASGVFGAMMDVELVNDGPVTLIIDR